MKKDKGLLTLLSAPARRALEDNGIKSLQQLASHSEANILKFHGIGKATIPVLKNALAAKGFSFKK